MPAASFHGAKSGRFRRSYWIEPEMRGIIPLDRFHLPGRLARTVRIGPFTGDGSTATSTACSTAARAAAGRHAHLDQHADPMLYRKLYERPPLPPALRSSMAMRLVGGLYGVSLAAPSSARACSRARDASKVGPRPPDRASAAPAASSCSTLSSSRTISRAWRGSMVPRRTISQAAGGGARQ